MAATVRNEWTELFERGVLRQKPAIEESQSALQHDPDDVRAHVVLAGAETHAVHIEHRGDVSFVHFYWLIDHRPDIDLGTWASTAFRRSSPAGDEAARRWIAAADRHPDDETILRNAMSCVVPLGRALAIPLARRWLARDPSDPERYEHLASLLPATELRSAFELRERALGVTTDPSAWVARATKLAWLAYRIERYGRARELAERALRLAPDDDAAIRACATLGRIVIAFGDAPLAMHCLFACALVPARSLAQPVFELAHDLVHVGRRLEVERYYDHCRGGAEVGHWRRLVDALK